MIHFNNTTAAKNDVEHIRGTLNHWQRVSRENSALIISLIMMLYYVLCEAVRDPYEEKGHFGGPDYGAALLTMLVIAVTYDYFSLQEKKKILAKYDDMNTDLLETDDEQFIELEWDIRHDLEWIDLQEAPESTIEKCARPVLFTANAVAAYSIAGEPGAFVASALILGIGFNEAQEKKAIRPRNL